VGEQPRGWSRIKKLAVPTIAVVSFLSTATTDYDRMKNPI
jgi:hypothetical protein